MTRVEKVQLPRSSITEKYLVEVSAFALFRQRFPIPKLRLRRHRSFAVESEGDSGIR